MSTVARTLKSTDGNDIYADATGDPQNPSIVFVHGMTFSGAVFDCLFANKRLLEKFYLVRYDMRGHGRSGKPNTEDGHSSSLYANDFATVVRAFGLRRPVFLGWSLGAAIITDICVHLGALSISGAIALGGPPSKDINLAAISFHGGSHFFRGLTSTTDVTLALDIRREFVDACFSAPESLPFAFRSACFGCALLVTPNQVMLASARKQDSSKLLHMKKEDLRLLIIAPTEDKLVNGRAVVNELKRGKCFGDVEIEVKEIKGGSHACFLDNEDETVDAVLEFANSVQGLINKASTA